MGEVAGNDSQLWVVADLMYRQQHPLLVGRWKGCSLEFNSSRSRRGMSMLISRKTLQHAACTCFFRLSTS